ncbi:hypothetical protein [Devosia sp. XK-2]|uniref:hypothetical protein n=1 Tax=Devosia sp. XK-2 TaxID=3126689 RepID=UPI0030D0226F
MTALRQFLQRNSISRANPLPLVHTTESYFIKKILAKGEIEARPCNVFRGENLSYFFVGRAAYKKEANQEADYWELPSCVVFEYFSDGVKRVFPFDSGAFDGGLYPNYINMMELSDFEIKDDPEAPQKLIGTFFNNPRDYYKLKARPDEQFKSAFDIDVLDEEILALHRLIGDRNEKFDDRRFAIEVQVNSAVSLSSRKPLLFIIPETYLGNRRYVESIEATGAEIFSYPLYPLRKQYYYYAIYDKLEKFYIERGYYV